MDLDQAGPSDTVVGEAYREFAPYVRRQLAKRGVRDSDLPDLCHEVFLILHRADPFREIERVDLWLREVCRRVAAGYRRRSQRTREILTAPGDLSADAELEAGELERDLIEWQEEATQVRNALERLDEESRELLALHDVGELPLTELAKLVEHDRRTVKKRLEAARRRLSVQLTREHLPAAGRPTKPRSAVSATAAVGLRSACDARKPRRVTLSGEFEIIAVTPGVVIGLIGNVVIATWPGSVDLASIETLSSVGPQLIERCGGKITYLAVVKAVIRPPPFAARKRMVRALDEMGPHVLGYATAMLGKTSWLVRPIMSGLLVLARPRFPMAFFDAVPRAASWLCANGAAGPSGPLGVAELCSAADEMSGTGTDARASS